MATTSLQSGDLPPTATSFSFAAAGLTPPEWSQVNAVVFRDGDLLGNEYEVHYQKTFGVQVETRLENQYCQLHADDRQPRANHQRLRQCSVPVGGP